jgi:hypothetical protein
MGYLTNEQTSQLLTEEMEKIFAKPITEADVEIICSLDDGLREFLHISDHNIKNRTVGLIELQAFSCILPLKDEKLVNRLINAKTENNPELLNIQMNIAFYSHVSNLEISPALKSYVKNQLMSKNDFLAGESLSFIAKLYPEDPDALTRAFKFIEESKDYTLPVFGYNALSLMRTKDSSVLNKVVSLIKKPAGNDGYLLQFIINSRSADSNIQKEFAGLLNNDGIQGFEKERILLHLQEMKASSIAVVEEVIKYAEGGPKNSYRNKALEILKGIELSPELKERVDKIR